jgi:hypothetical protein
VVIRLAGRSGLFTSDSITLWNFYNGNLVDCRCHTGGDYVLTAHRVLR